MRNPDDLLRLTFRVICLLLALVCVQAVGVAQTADTETGVVTGHNGIAAAAQPLASQAAIDMLKAGGNAVDAAVAAAFAIGVVEPDGSGLGGGGGMVIYLAETGQSIYINYYQSTSHEIQQITYDTENDRHSAKAVLVPGTVAGLTLALEKFGTLPLARVLEPAIRYAEEGFEVDATLASLLLDNLEMLQADPATAEVFLDEGFPKMEGDLLIQPALAKTLKTIAAEGRDGFYRGPVAEALSSTITAMGGILTMEDLASFEAELTTPLEGSYRGYRIISANVPQSGASIIQALNMFEHENLAQSGHYSKSARTLHIMAETFRRVYADRWQFLGDPNFSYVPVNGLISKQFAQERYNEINRYKADPRQYRATPAGNPARYDQARTRVETMTVEPSQKVEWGDDEEEMTSGYEDWGENVFDSWGGRKKSGDTKTKTKKAQPVKDSSDALDDDDEPDDEKEYDGGHTTHLSVIDKNGNMVALTQTLGTFFGAGITIEGVLMNCGMSNFSTSAAVNMVKPDMRPRSSISPTVVLKDNKPFMVVGSPGAGRIPCAVAEILVNVIDFGMNAYEANSAPRFYCQKFDDYLYLEGGIDPAVAEELERMGHTLRKYEGLDLFFGGAQLILVDPATGLYYGSADPRRGGRAVAY